MKFKKLGQIYLNGAILGCLFDGKQLFLNYKDNDEYGMRYVQIDPEYEFHIRNFQYTSSEQLMNGYFVYSNARGVYEIFDIDNNTYRKAPLWHRVIAVSSDMVMTTDGPSIFKNGDNLLSTLWVTAALINGTQLITASDKQVDTWDISTGEHIKTICAFPDEKYLCSALFVFEEWVVVKRDNDMLVYSGDELITSKQNVRYLSMTNGILTYNIGDNVFVSDLTKQETTSFVQDNVTNVFTDGKKLWVFLERLADVYEIDP